MLIDSTEPETQQRQANFRVAVSRAYYAAFQFAYNYLRDKEEDALILYDYSRAMNNIPALASHRNIHLMKAKAKWSGTDAQLKDEHRNRFFKHDYGSCK